jgi:diacylglycerol kinase
MKIYSSKYRGRKNICKSEAGEAVSAGVVVEVLAVVLDLDRVENVCVQIAITTNLIHEVFPAIIENVQGVERH